MRLAMQRLQCGLLPKKGKQISGGRALRQKQQFCRNREGREVARGVGLWPELLTAGRYAGSAKPGQSFMDRTSPLICLDHSDTVGAKAQKSRSLLDGVVTLCRKAKGTLV